MNVYNLIVNPNDIFIYFLKYYDHKNGNKGFGYDQTSENSNF